MATDAQIHANRENAKHSSGPKTEEGKAKSCMNNFRWGFRGKFTVLPSESQEEFDMLLDNLRAEHKPQCIMEDILVLKMAQHFWLSQRAQMLADLSMDAENEVRDPEKTFALWLRYQTANDRGFHRCVDQLLKLRAQRVKEVIGFERQNRAAEQAEAKQNRDRHQAELRQAAENRKQELHQLAVLLAQAKLDRQSLLNFQLDPSNPLALAATERLQNPERQRAEVPQAA